MNTLTIAHLSDLHWSADRLADKIRSGQQIIAKLEDIQPDIVIIAGDAYDHSLRVEDAAALESFTFFQRCRAAAKWMLCVKGNFGHDRNSIEVLRTFGIGIDVSTQPEVYEFDGWTLWRRSLEEAAKHEAFKRPIFCTLPYPSSEFLAKTARLNPEDMSQAISEALRGIIQGFAAIQVREGVPKILVFHGTVPEAKISKDQHVMGMEIQLRLSDIDACGFDLVCAGHIHFSQKIGRNVFYPGGIVHTHWGDTGEKGFWVHRFEGKVHRFEGKTLQSDFIAVDAVPMRIVELDFADPFWELPEWIAGPSPYDIQVRLKLLEADRERYRAFDWPAVFPAARLIDLVPKVETVASVRSEEVRKAHTLPEKIAAWGRQTETIVAQTVLDKAALVEDRDGDALVSMMKE